MDAMLEEKLTLDEFWSVYVGNVTPLEFMNRMYSPDIETCAEAYVASLPALYGIVRRQTWKESFTAPCQYRRGEVLAAIVEKLEKTEAEWRPHLNQRPEPAPAPAWTPQEQPDAEQHPASDPGHDYEDTPPLGDEYGYTPPSATEDPVVEEIVVEESAHPAEEVIAEGQGQLAHGGETPGADA